MIVLSSMPLNALPFKAILISSRLLAGIGQSWSIVVVAVSDFSL